MGAVCSFNPLACAGRYLRSTSVMFRLGQNDPVFRKRNNKVFLQRAQPQVPKTQTDVIFFFFFFLSRSLSAEMRRVWLKQPCYKLQNHSSHINRKEGQNRGGPTQVWCVGALCVCSVFYSFTNKHWSLDKRLKLILAVLIIAEQGSFWVDIVCKSTECTRISIIIAIIIKWGRREKHQTHMSPGPQWGANMRLSLIP